MKMVGMVMERDLDPIRTLDLGLIELWIGWYGENSVLSRAPIEYGGSKWNLYEFVNVTFNPFLDQEMGGRSKVDSQPMTR